MRSLVLRCAVLAVVAGLTVPGGAEAAPPGLVLGFNDNPAFVSPLAPDNALNLARAKDAGASVVRYMMDWSAVAPVAPPDATTARDPAWSGYRFQTLDQAARQAAAAGVRLLPVVLTAPAWAEGPGRPAIGPLAPRGTWRPSTKAIAGFATALARRYSGTFPDPLTSGATLPAVRIWQAWNEPNLSTYLAPQWRSQGRGYAVASPEIYRGLLNAFYRAVKAVDPANVVITAGTAPFGDLHGGEPRMPPVRFWRALLCVKGHARPRSTHCGRTVSFDAIAHHPYPIGPPRRHARNADDVVVPDLGKITRLLSVAIKARTVRPAKPKPLWITEISWDSAPDPDGLSEALQAKYLQAALYVLWKQGADVVTWWRMVDDAPVPSYATTYQAGIFRRGPTPVEGPRKLSWTAFRFPFTAYRVRGTAQLWGMAPSAGPVTIEARRGTRWVTAMRLTAGANRIFTGRLRVGRGTDLRARTATLTSLTWTTF